MIELNGSHEEGGGSILRMSLALSLYTQKPFRLKNIRKYRKKPGLNNQHLAAINLAKEISNAKVIGNKKGSQKIEFYPNQITSKKIEIDIKSAGSVVLALQSILLPCVLSEKNFNITLKGGTDVAWSPNYEYYKEVFLHAIKDLAKIDFKLLKRGYYPKGQGIVQIKIKGYKQKMLKPLKLTELGKLILIKIISTASKKLEKINFAENEADQAKMQLKELGVPITTEINYSETESEGSSLLVYGVFEKNNEQHRIGAYQAPPVIGEPINKEVVENFKKIINKKTPVDEFFADQIIPYVAILSGEIKTTPLKEHLTKHLLSNIYVAEKFLEKKITITETGTIKTK